MSNTFSRKVRRPCVHVSSYVLNQIHLRNPWVTVFWSLAFPGAGHIMLCKYFTGFMLMLWEWFVWCLEPFTDLFGRRVPNYIGTHWNGSRCSIRLLDWNIISRKESFPKKHKGRCHSYCGLQRQSSWDCWENTLESSSPWSG